LRVLIVIQEKQPLSTVLLHPITWLGTLLFAAMSTADGVRGVAPRWRGRSLPAEAPS
jgi:hypothetical protein